MKHRLFTTATAISLLLCLACICLWVRSGFVNEAIEKEYQGSQFLLASATGNLQWQVFRQTSLLSNSGWKYLAAAVDNRPTWEWRRPCYVSNNTMSTLPPRVPGTLQRQLLPYWVLTSSTALLPGFCFWQRRQAKKAARRHRRGFEVEAAGKEMTKHQRPMNDQAQMTNGLRHRLHWRHMKHRLFTTAAALSLLLCLACIAMWVRSGFMEDYAFVPHNARAYGSSLLSQAGALSLNFGHASEPHPRLHWEAYALSGGWESGWLFPIQYHPSYNTLALPYWLPTLLTIILPALWFRKRRRAKKAARRRGFEVQPATEKNDQAPMTNE